jgi:hypothetical protein
MDPHDEHLDLLLEDALQQLQQHRYRQLLHLAKETCFHLTRSRSTHLPFFFLAIVKGVLTFLLKSVLRTSYKPAPNE